MGGLRYTVFGAGAVGGVIAAHLARDNAVSVVARGAHLEAIRRGGLDLLGMDGDRETRHVTAAEKSADLEPADIVIVTLKAQAVAALAAEIDGARKPDGTAVFLQNGLPWWLAPRAGSCAMLDPACALRTRFPRCSAAVAHFGAALVAPGIVRQTAPGRLLLGAALAEQDARLEAMAEELASSGMDAAVVTDIRPVLWRKLQINVALNGIAALTRAPILDILESAELKPVLLGLTGEVAAIASAMGHSLSFDLDALKQIIRPGQKSSTLQDIEAGKPIEHDALFGSVLELATSLGISAPMLSIVVPLIGGLSRQLEGRAMDRDR